MYYRVCFHIVWTTLDRMPTIDFERAACLRRILPTAARENGGQLLGIGIVQTHLHVLVRATPRFDCARFVGRAKSVSSLLSRREGLGDPDRPLRWATGYSVTSVGPNEVGRIRQYVLGQARRHPEEAIPEGPSE